MTSDTIYVWTWLPGSAEPVVAGRLDRRHDQIVFTYGTSYLGRDQAIPLASELPLRRGAIAPDDGLQVAGVIADAAPDSWGQRVILHRRVGGNMFQRDTNELDLFTYLFESGSDRIGALDFQTTATTYQPRHTPAPLDELMTAADRLLAGEPFSAELDQALLHGSSVGGARPKALLDDGDKKMIAKFSMSTDLSPVVKAEGVAMSLARRAGVQAATSTVVEVGGRDVMLVDRFDRLPGGGRRLMLSMLTLQHLDEMTARYASYHELADLVRQSFDRSAPTLAELFRRSVVNVAVGNTDDHARNHAAFWNGSSLSLTPAYDICPQPRSGGYTEQAIAIGRDGSKQSTFETCRSWASVYGLSSADATDIIDHVVTTIRDEWSDAADESRLTRAEREQLWERPILNPFAFTEP